MIQMCEEPGSEREYTNGSCCDSHPIRNAVHRTCVTEQRWGGVMILLKALMCLLLTNAGEVGSVARGQTQLNDFQLKNF